MAEEQTGQQTITDTDPPKKDSVNVSFQLPKELFDKVSAEADEEDRNISQQVRRIVRLYYEAQDAREPMPS